jgi:transcriptional regulator with XRE-family HTH domain
MSNRIRQLREEHNLTLSELSTQLQDKENLKLSPDAIAKYERQDREPKLETWKKLANFFGVSTIYLQGIDTEYAAIQNEFYERFSKFRKNHKYSEQLNYVQHLKLNSLDNSDGWTYEKHLTDQQIDNLLNAVDNVYNSRLAYLDSNKLEPDPNIDNFFNAFDTLIGELYSAALGIHMPEYDNSRHGIDFKKLEETILPVIYQLKKINKKINEEMAKQDEENFKKYGTYSKPHD